MDPITQINDQIQAASDIDINFLKTTFPVAESVVQIHDNHFKKSPFAKILKHPANHKYYRLSDEGYFIWQLLDGQHSILAIILAVYQREDQLLTQEIINLLTELAELGLVSGLDKLPKPVNIILPPWLKVVEKLRSILEINITFKGADRWLGASYHSFVHYLYTPLSYVVMGLIALIGFVLFIITLLNVPQMVSQSVNVIQLLFWAYLFVVILTPLHELAHAYTAKHFGREVQAFGVGWYWIGPVAFADTTDMWLAKKTQCLAVNAAGMIFDAILNGLIMIIGFIIQDPTLLLIAWLCTAYNYLSILDNCHPLFELDGYYLLMDYFERPNLRAEALFWLIKLLPGQKSRALTADYSPELWYWFFCIFFMISVPLAAWLMAYLFFMHVFPVLQHGLIRWLLLTAAIVLSFAAVWVDVKKNE